MNLLDMDARSVAAGIRSGETTSVKAVKTYIKHLRYTNPDLNYLVEDRFKKALDEARQADQETVPQGKLHGVPFSMKEAYHVEDMKTTGGLIHRRKHILHTDAEIVAKLKAEGAIILGKTNTPVLCFYQESDNKLYGRTNNPWNRARTVGGSSGGEGALMAVGGAAAGIGSDIGGSIRFPAHFNGVVGFKSGMYQVSQQGNFPFIEHSLQQRMLGMGPMTKTVRDNAFIYHIIAKSPAPKRNISNFKVTLLPRMMDYPLSAVTESLLMQINEALSEDFSTQTAVPPYLNESAQIWQELMSIDGADRIAHIAFGECPARRVREYLKEITTGTSPLNQHLLWVLIGAKMFQPSKKRLRKIKDMLAHGDRLLDRYLEQRILIFPVYHTGAPKHGKLYHELFNIRKTYLKYMPYIAYANVWGLPALTVPVGRDEHGMPIAVQLMSKNGNENALFQLGEIIEKQFRGYVRSRKRDKDTVNESREGN